jgi:hypothetical protein
VGGERISLAPFFVAAPELPPSPYLHDLLRRFSGFPHRCWLRKNSRFDRCPLAWPVGALQPARANLNEASKGIIDAPHRGLHSG